MPLPWCPSPSTAWGEGEWARPHGHVRPGDSLTKQVLGTHLGHTVRPAQAAAAGEGRREGEAHTAPLPGDCSAGGGGDSLGSTGAAAHGPQLAHGVLGRGWRWGVMEACAAWVQGLVDRVAELTPHWGLVSGFRAPRARLGLLLHPPQVQRLQPWRPGQIPQCAWAGCPQGAEPCLLDVAGPPSPCPSCQTCAPISLQTLGPPQGAPERASRGVPLPRLSGVGLQGQCPGDSEMGLGEEPPSKQRECMFKGPESGGSQHERTAAQDETESGMGLGGRCGPEDPEPSPEGAHPQGGEQSLVSLGQANMSYGVCAPWGPLTRLSLCGGFGIGGLLEWVLIGQECWYLGVGSTLGLSGLIRSHLRGGLPRGVRGVGASDHPFPCATEGPGSLRMGGSRGLVRFL